MNLTHPFLDEDGDKLREECGVFGAINATDAAAATALGLHALQHRGQEAAGITSFDGAEFYTRRGLGHVAENFSSQEAIAELPGTMAAGHVRYSTTGGSGLRNVQPLFADLAAGGFAIAHNGNISNAATLREELVGNPLTGVLHGGVLDLGPIARANHHGREGAIAKVGAVRNPGIHSHFIAIHPQLFPR